AQNGIDFGDYEGLAFYGGNFYPVWADNSNSTHDNPDGTLHELDIYTAKVHVHWRASGDGWPDLPERRGRSERAKRAPAPSPIMHHHVSGRTPRRPDERSHRWS